MAFDISTLNTRIGWAYNRATGMSELYNLTKPGYRTYSLNGMSGYVYIQRNNSGGDSWNFENSGSTIMTTADSGACGGTYEGAWSYIGRYRLNCTTNTTTNNCGNNCNCANACGNCYSHPSYENPISVNEWNGSNITYGSGQCYAYYQCAQCSAPVGNCDTQSWLQPNCNCLNCDCACNCMNFGQCTTIVVNCDCGGGT